MECAGKAGEACVAHSDVGLSTHAPQVAVIMRSKNEQPYVEKALAGLKQQTYRNYVLYNVDSGSDDGTFEVVQRFNPVSERVWRIPPEAYIPAKVLNWMIGNTSESIIVLQNADAIPANEHWLENLLRPIISGQADATMSRQLGRADAPLIVRADMRRGYDPEEYQRKQTDFYSAVACAFRRSLWEQTKFRTESYCEDLAWSKECHEKGGRFQLPPDAVVEHSHHFPIKELYRKRHRDGAAFVEIYGTGPSFADQLAEWAKETARDLLTALVGCRPDTIPYNLVYRATIHWAYYRGKCEGQRRYLNRNRRA